MCIRDRFRAMPGISVMRPCDRRETAAAWKYAMESKNEPVILVLSRQNLAQQDTSSADISKGAYILQDSKNEVPELILMSSGSEIGITVEAADKLRADGVDVDVYKRQDISELVKTNIEIDDREENV